MTLDLEATTKIVNLDGVPCRIWEGHTSSGIPVHAFITRVVVDKDEDNTQFKEELEEQRQPSPELENYPLNLIL